MYSLPGLPWLASTDFPVRHDALVVLLGSGIGSSVLALETDGLVDEQMTCDRVASGDDSEANDNTCICVSLCNAAAIIVFMTNREESTQRGSCGVVGGVARRCEL